MEEGSLAYFYDPNPQWGTRNDCYEFVCTAPWNACANDIDGGLLGNELGGYILANNPGIAKQGCKMVSESNAFFCETSSASSYNYAVLIFESLDTNAQDRTISPIEITCDEFVSA